MVEASRAETQFQVEKPDPANPAYRYQAALYHSHSMYMLPKVHTGICFVEERVQASGGLPYRVQGGNIYVGIPTRSGSRSARPTCE